MNSLKVILSATCFTKKELETEYITSLHVVKGLQRACVCVCACEGVCVCVCVLRRVSVCTYELEREALA